MAWAMLRDFSIFSALVVVVRCRGDSEVYHTSKGPVFGYHQDDGVRVFRSIPYAAPPTGASGRRWMDPVPAEPWTDPRNVSMFPNECMQEGKGGNTTGSEDCLYLYLYTTNPSSNISVLQPVLLWIHGGGFQTGSAHGQTFDGGITYDGSRLAKEQGVVVIAIQYRLASFGWLALDAFRSADGGVGNFGLKDQRAAMQWARRDVAAFGGDPTRVTIFGESSGGFAMCYHLISPASAGLFSAAIMESGACQIGILARVENSTKFGAKFAAAVGCTGSEQEVRSCMLAKPAEDLVYPNGPNPIPLIPNGENFMNNFYPWGHTIGTPDVPDIPSHLLLTGKFHKVPVIFGSNANEFQCMCLGPGNHNLSNCGFINAVPKLLGGNVDLDTDTDLRRVLEYMLNPARWTGLTDSQFGSIVDKYPAAQFHSGAERLSKMLVDSNRWMGHCSTVHAAQLIQAHSPDVWVYHFDLPGNKLLTGGVTGHGAEIPFVWQRCDALPLGALCQGATAKQFTVASAIFANSWASLARTGDPGLAWPRLGRNSTILQIGPGGGTPESRYRADFCTLWNSFDPWTQPSKPREYIYT